VLIMQRRYVALTDRCPETAKVVDGKRAVPYATVLTGCENHYPVCDSVVHTLFVVSIFVDC